MIVKVYFNKLYLQNFNLNYSKNLSKCPRRVFNIAGTAEPGGLQGL